MRDPNFVRWLFVCGALAAGAAGEGAAQAQARRPTAQPSAPPSAQPSTQPKTEAPATTEAATTSAVLAPVPDELMRTSPDGITSEQVGRRAAETSYSAKASEETMRAAAARVDTAWAAFLPRLTGTARYTRNSPYTPLSFQSETGQDVRLPPPILNDYLLQANITVPITDYFLKINQAYTAATLARDAARFDAAAARAKSGSDGRVAYYSWMRARGAVVVAVQALNDQRTHLNDARNQFGTGGVSKADVLRAETAVAAAELAVERAKNLAELTEKQVRIAMHGPASERIVPGESLESAPAPFAGNLEQLTNEALAARLEVKSIEANAEAARKQARAAGSTRFPTVSAFGDAFYVNPNPQSVPQAAEWYPAYDYGVQAIWSPNDILTAGGQIGDAEHRAAALDAQKQVTRDGITVEVLDAFQKVREADFAFESTRRELTSATEAYRVAHDLFNAGRGTSTTLTDAEGELTRARLDELNARVDARIARVRLEHALGRDAKLASAP